MLSPTFTTGRLKSMIDPIDGIADTLVEHLKLKVKENQELNIKPILQGFTMDAICKVAFGMQTNFHNDQDQDLYKLGTGAIKAFTPKSYLDDFFFLIFFHFPELVPGGFWNEDALKLSKITRELMATRDEKNIQMGDFIGKVGLKCFIAVLGYQKYWHVLNFVPNSISDFQKS